MKSAIIAFDALRNPSRSSSKTGGDVRKEFKRMQAEKEPLDGLTVVELWTEDRGFESRYFSSETKPEPSKKKGIFSK